MGCSSHEEAACGLRMQEWLRTGSLHSLKLVADGGELILEANQELENDIELRSYVTAALGRHCQRSPLGAAFVEGELLLERVGQALGLRGVRLEFLEPHLPPVRERSARP